MTGSGTRTDPYIVDNWSEFESVVTKSRVIIKFNPDAENKIIDMNNLYPEGCPVYTIGTSSQVHGNGWEIQNLYLKNPLFRGGAVTISGFKFTSFNHETSQAFLLGTSGYRSLFEKNIFSGKTCSTGFLTPLVSGGNYGTAIDCYNNSFDLTVYNDVTFQLADYLNAETTKKDIMFNNIKIHLTGNSKINSNGLFGECYYHNFVNNRINVIANTGCDFPIVKKSSGFSGNVILGSNSGAIKPLYSGTCTGVNIYNSDTLNYTGTDSRFKGCTTEQIRNAEYLQSIGFAIGVEE